MKPVEQDNQSDIQLLRTVVFGIGTGLLCWMLLLWRFPIEPAIAIWILVMTFLFFRFSSAVYVLVAVVIILPLLSRQRFANQIASDVPELSTLLFALVLLSFVWFGFRFIDALSASSLFQNRSFETVNRRRTPPQNASTGTGAAGLLVLPVAVVLAVLFLAMFPENGQSKILYRLTPPGLRAITFIWVAGISWVIIKSCFSLIGWFRLSPQEAGLYVRNIFGHETRRELGKIERIRSKLKGGLD